MGLFSQVLQQIQKRKANASGQAADSADSAGAPSSGPVGRAARQAGGTAPAQSGQPPMGLIGSVARQALDAEAAAAPPSPDDAARTADAKMQRRLARQRGFASTILAGDLVNGPTTAQRGLLGSFQ